MFHCFVEESNEINLCVVSVYREARYANILMESCLGVLGQS